MRINGTLQYLHADHLGSTVLTTDGNSAVNAPIIGDEGYLAYGRNRRGNGVPTDFKFTGQKQDGSGLQYFNSRYYDPQVGVFISPDTTVPDATTVFDYQRYMCTRGNPLRFSDPSGHDPLDVNWLAAFYAVHKRLPTQDDVRVRLFSLVARGSESNGDWNAQDWANYEADPEEFINKYYDQGKGPGGGGPGGLEGFAAGVETLAGYYNPGEEAQFVMAIGTLYGGLEYNDPKNVADNQINAHLAGDVHLRPVFEGSQGWNPLYNDPSDNNPSHHFAGLFYAGYFYGTVAGQAINFMRDAATGYNGPDFLLGIVSVNQGGRFAQGQFSMSMLGNVIRSVGAAPPLTSDLINR